MSYSCGLCMYKSRYIEKYNHHQAIHKTLPRALFKCMYNGCLQQFAKYTSCKIHVCRNHFESKKSRPHVTNKYNLLCNVENCNLTFCVLKDLLTHMSKHICEGVIVKCPYFNCSPAVKYKTVNQITLLSEAL